MIKRSIVFFASLMLITIPGYSQKPIPLWEGEIPFNKKGIKVDEINDNNRISKVTIPVIYHFEVNNKSVSDKPAVVIIPGGGYSREAIDHEGWLAAQWFTQIGIEAFVLKYRLPDGELVTNQHLVPLIDAQQAIALVRENAAKYGINPGKIGVIGFSAGGHLAASVSNLFNNPVNNNKTATQVRPDFSILVYPVITMDDNFTHKGSKENLIGKNPTEELVTKYSMEKQVSDKTPVTFLIHSLNDLAVPIKNSDIYAENLYKKGGDVTKIVLPYGGHGFGFKPDSQVSWWAKYLEIWIKTRIIND